jgi:hypothetical protein
MILTASRSSLFPAAQGFKRFGFDGTSLYIDANTTSWIPVGGGGGGGTDLTAGVSTTGGGITQGSTGTANSNLWLYPGKNITFSGATAANVYSLTVLGNDILQLLISGNTGGVASTYTAGSLTISAGQGVTISEGANVLTIQGNTLQTLSSLQVPIGAFPGGVTAAAGAGLGFGQYMPFQVTVPMVMASLDQFFSIGHATAAGSSLAKTISVSAGIYNTANPMATLSTASTTSAYTVTVGSFSGTSIKRVAIPWALTIQPGDYVLGLWSSSATAGNALALTQSQIVNIAALAWTFGGDLTASVSAASHQLVRFFGTHSVSSAALQAAVQASDVKGANNVNYPIAIFRGFGTV